ncbi:MAG: hypothetical protein HQL53_08450 [Magnetococcales bacterium]|nr:hypothetical protein [Magnetococcales bacterium]
MKSPNRAPGTSSKKSQEKGALYKVLPLLILAALFLLGGLLMSQAALAQEQMLPEEAEALEAEEGDEEDSEVSGRIFGGEVSGYVAGELRVFPETAAYAGQKGEFLSFSGQPEFYRAWEDGRQSFTLIPFFRLDPQDDDRTHADLRELTWMQVGERWELRLGVRRLFWGVTESRHLVDVINQTDAVEGLDGEDKLGQPMVNLALIRDWGTLDLLWLPWFRERTFAGPKGRPRPGLMVDHDRSRYASSSEERHQDWAIRWSHAIGAVDLGISHFQGTSRDPLFLTEMYTTGQVVLVPYYDQIRQTGLDLQFTDEAWLWKLEVLSRRGEFDGRRTEAVGGFEYSMVGIFESDADMGLIAEYLFDDRGDASTQPFDNDLMVGMRLTMNDTQSTDAVIGTIIDLEDGTMAWTLEGSRRLGESWKLTLEGRAYLDPPTSDPIYTYRRDHLLSLEIARYF